MPPGDTLQHGRQVAQDLVDIDQRRGVHLLGAALGQLLHEPRGPGHFVQQQFAAVADGVALNRREPPLPFGLGVAEHGAARDGHFRGVACDGLEPLRVAQSLLERPKRREIFDGQFDRVRSDRSRQHADEQATAVFPFPGRFNWLDRL